MPLSTNYVWVYGQIMTNLRRCLIYLSVLNDVIGKSDYYENKIEICVNTDATLYGLELFRIQTLYITDTNIQ